MDGERLAYLTLALVPGIGPERFRVLLERFGSADGALAAPLASLRQVPGLSDAAATVVAAADRTATLEMLERLEALGGRALLSPDAEFPALLREIPDPPPLLFAQGSLELLDRPAVAIVGSRDHSAYGAEACRAVAAAAARAGLCVVSGMARGLDAVAHLAALDAGGGTIGVLGNGLGVVYPAANRALYDRVRTSGLLLTEFPPGERPHTGHFPRRNRLISGLARATVVIEAAIRSGALQTVQCALAQGREVLAVPGPITSPVSGGTNRLIRDGAAPLLETADLLVHYPNADPAAAGELFTEAGRARTEPARKSSPAERRLLDALASSRLALDELVTAAQAPAPEVLSLLCALELAGEVAQGTDGRYAVASR